jgi:uncharacterized protein YuzE
MMPVTFQLDGRPLVSDYDEEADILYLWTEGPRPSVTYEDDDGHLVQLDPDTREFVGVMIVDFKARWDGREIRFRVPKVEEHLLQPLPA